MSRDDLETTDETAGDDGRELDRQITDYLRLGVPTATIVCAIVAGVYQGAASVILVLAGGALVSVIAIFWASVRTLVGETPLSGADAYALGAPRAEEEQKRAVLRALKDLEFERSVGKISAEDYQALVGRYRAEAKRLLRMLDEEAEPARQNVEALVMDRLLREGLADDAARGGYRDAPIEGKPGKKAKAKAKLAAKVTAKADEAKAEDAKVEDAKAEDVKVEGAKAEDATIDDAKGDDAKVDDAKAGIANAGDAKVADAKAAATPPKTHEGDAAPGSTCASCKTRNDADAAFCKRCGARFGAEDDEGDEPLADVKENAGRGEAS